MSMIEYEHPEESKTTNTNKFFYRKGASNKLCSWFISVTECGVNSLKRFLICIAALVLGLTGVSEAQLITEVSRGGSSANTPPTSGGTLVEGSGAMVDRNHAYKQIPDFLAGQAEYIKVANNDKSVANYQLTVTLAANADVYLFIDCRVGDGNPSTPPVLTSAMPWVSQMGFADTGAKIGIDEGSNGTINGWYQVYKAAYSAGNLTLGAQNNGGDRIPSLIWPCFLVKTPACQSTIAACPETSATSPRLIQPFSL
jgi:hypothetical protein